MFPIKKCWIIQINQDHKEIPFSSIKLVIAGLSAVDISNKCKLKKNQCARYQSEDFCDMDDQTDKESESTARLRKERFV